LKNETDTLEHFFEFLIEQKFHINNKNHYNSNKLIALYLAQKHGLKIPKTLITKNASEIKNFLETEKQVITKNIQDVLNVKEKDFAIGHIPHEIFSEDIKNENYFYSLFQQKIKIKYELRILFLFEKYYSHAKICYNTNLYRITPFDLPSKIEKKLKNLMSDLKLESGSIDMLVDEKDNYYYLEVNPVGQFDYLSGFNNYYIEREIAKTLIYGKESKIS
jgi:glutathione synthase/RimK-type ligase-like ATP-grasp enzyme